MTTTTQVHTAIAERLDAAGVGVYKPADVYAAHETAITIKAVPTTPDRIVAVTVYDDDQNPDPGDLRVTYFVQLRFRAGLLPTDVDDIADAAHVAMSVHHQVWSGVRVSRCHRTGFAQIGPDANGRQERTDNYQLVTQR